MTYLDASVLISWLVTDVHTPRVGAWFASARQPLIVSDLAGLEVSAVLSRDLRTGKLTRDEVETALLDLDALRARCRPHRHSQDDYRVAETLVRDFATKLAAADALHLASAGNAGAELATFDERMRAAARMKGIGLTMPI